MAIALICFTAAFVAMTGDSSPIPEISLEDILNRLGQAPSSNYRQGDGGSSIVNIMSGRMTFCPAGQTWDARRKQCMPEIRLR